MPPRNDAKTPLCNLIKNAGNQGLLTLRNSWGEEVGDHGNYYMSYDYFLKLAVEEQVIANSKKQQASFSHP